MQFVCLFGREQSTLLFLVFFYFFAFFSTFVLSSPCALVRQTADLRSVARSKSGIQEDRVDTSKLRAIFTQGLQQPSHRPIFLCRLHVNRVWSNRSARNRPCST